MCSDREQIIEKIKKLLALSSKNTNENEALADALKAQKLIADYDIEEYELGEKNQEPIECTSEVGQGKNWRFQLATVVANNFRCANYIISSTVHNYWTGRNNVKSREVVFIGYPLDAEAAKLTFEKLYEVGNRLASKAAREAKAKYGYADGVYNSFAAGFVAGVKQELEKQCEALMLVRPQAVQAVYDSLEFSNAKIHHPRNRYLAESRYSDGENAGRDAVRSGRLGSKEQSLLPA